MHTKFLPALKLTAAFLGAAYLGMVVVTIYYAAEQTRLANTMADTQTQITVLESAYYDSVAKLDATDPHALGFVKPANVAFVTTRAQTTLTFASR